MKAASKRWISAIAGLALSGASMLASAEPEFGILASPSGARTSS